MSGQGFRVNPEALRKVAAEFELVASQLAEAIAAFSRASEGVRPEAFGLLLEGRAAGSAYLQKSEQALRGLTAIKYTMLDVAGGLRTSAVNYLAADEESVPASL